MTFGASAPVRRCRALVVLALLVALLAACNPDPTTAPPPARSAPVPPFTATAHRVGPGTPWPLTGTWKPGCPVGTELLALLEVAHWGYDGRRYTGRLVVHAWLGPAFTQVFRDLYDARFPIARIQGIGAYGGDDARSMAANNSSAFNCRKVSGTDRWSEHAFGTAVDINPVQNPFVKGNTVQPPAGSSWLDRTTPTPGMIRDGDVVVRAFARAGLKWGGHWTSSKDYQHFSQSGR